MHGSERMDFLGSSHKHLSALQGDGMRGASIESVCHESTTPWRADEATQLASKLGT